MFTISFKPRISAISGSQIKWHTNFGLSALSVNAALIFRKKIVDEEIIDLAITHKMQQTTTFYEVWFSQK